MTDYLIVHDVGQGAWFWNKVWGNATAPAEHPPKLYTPRCSSQFYLLNLPGHGTDEMGDTGEVRLDEGVQAITRAVERRGLQDLVLVGHGVGGMLALQAAPELPVAPKHLALVAGVVPEKNRNPLGQFPGPVRKHLSSRLNFSKLRGKDIRLPRSVITRYLCNGMQTREVTQALGFFGPLPSRMLETRVELPLDEIPCPISYIVLDQDRMLPPTLQISMARRIPRVELLHVDSCHQACLQKPRELGDILLSLGNRSSS